MSNRQRTVSGIVALAFYAVLAAGSFGAPVVQVTIAQIIQHRKLLIALATQTMQASRESAQSIDAAFADLSMHLVASSLTTQTVTGMEDKNRELQARSAELHLRMSETKTVAHQLFEMLEARAKENSTPEMRRQMLDDIKERRRSFDERMETAEGAINRVAESAKKYDDVVGYVQVQAGLQGIDQHIGRIDSIIMEANALDEQIQAAIRDGLTIIEPITPAA
jgi:DNA repair exonuclease SbcCD ATPase subunit